MFPGDEQLVLVFEDTGRRAAARCCVHPALVEELRIPRGAGNVAVTEEKKRVARRALYGILSLIYFPPRIGTGRGDNSGV